jgi:hypothetical protein
MQKETWPIVLCPGCKGQQMDIRQIVPMKPGDRQDVVTYRCPRCGFETERIAARPGAVTRPAASRT